MSQNFRVSSVLQWRVALVAGLVAGAVFLFVAALYTGLRYGLSLWVILRYIASIALGPGVLPPPASFDAGIVIVGLLVNFVLAILYAFVLASLIHRWGLLVGIVGGALFGAALYFINLYTFTLFYPWFFALHGTALFLSHVVYGAVAGSVYELLDYRDDAPLMPNNPTGGVRA